MAKGAKGAKGPKVTPQAATPVATAVTLKITVDAMTARFLRLEAFERGCSLGHVVQELVGSAPSQLVVTRRKRGTSGEEVQGGPSGPAAPRESAGPGAVSGPSVPGPSLARGAVGPLQVVREEVA